MQVTAEAHVAEITDPGHEKTVPTIATCVALERSVSNEFRLTLNATINFLNIAITTKKLRKE